MNRKKEDLLSPSKGILKSSHNLENENEKRVKFDEVNILKTNHPVDKDYGYMKIEEPKTPYNYIEKKDNENQLDVNLLLEKLKLIEEKKDDDDDDTEIGIEIDKQTSDGHELDIYRKFYYKEFDVVNLARKLMMEEDTEEGISDNDNNKINMKCNCNSV